METAQLNIREAKPSDYKEIKSVMDAWWGRSVSHLQHELFFDHFYNTAFIAEFNDGKIVGFINGFYSQTELSTAYVHFIGVDPVLRNSGLGKKLYERFFLVSREYGCSKLKSCTSKALGFWKVDQ